MALGQLVNGQWTTQWAERDEKGQFQRMPTQFRHPITADGASGFKAQAGRYHLYISLGCPWAHRTAILWKLKGLDNIVGLSIVADWCLFTTLFRFDLAYYGLFKCNLKRLVDFPHLWNYCRELYQYPDVQSVCSVDHVKRLYYAGLPELNPHRIVPAGPDINLMLPHTR